MLRICPCVGFLKNIDVSECNLKITKEVKTRIRVVGSAIYNLFFKKETHTCDLVGSRVEFYRRDISL